MCAISCSFFKSLLEKRLQKGEEASDFVSPLWPGRGLVTIDSVTPLTSEIFPFSQKYPSCFIAPCTLLPKLSRKEKKAAEITPRPTPCLGQFIPIASLKLPASILGYWVRALDSAQPVGGQPWFFLNSAVLALAARFFRLFFAPPRHAGRIYMCDHVLSIDSELSVVREMHASTEKADTKRLRVLTFQFNIKVGRSHISPIYYTPNYKSILLATFTWPKSQNVSEIFMLFCSCCCPWQ